jgi:acetyl-CoA carboxylase biotin carboxyl carrier protein
VSEQDQPDVEPSDAAPTDPQDSALQSRILAAVDRLAPILVGGPLEELEVESGDLVVRLAKPRAAAPAAAAPAAPAQTPAASTSPYGEPAPGTRFVTAPLTGVWYTAPSPGARPYVTIGGEVASGQVVGLIEAMKLFNEIKSDRAGRVVKINAEDGKLVRAKQPLIEVEPL